MDERPKVIALTGVPNVGKTTLFNVLTGLNQKVGNYPGVTVDKKSGWLTLDGNRIEILDLPGTYNIYPQSEDEEVVFNVLCDPNYPAKVDGVGVVVDMSNLERGLFLATQIIDLGYPTSVILNMEDVARKEGVSVNRNLLERLLGVPVQVVSADKGTGLVDLKRSFIEEDFKVGKLSVQCDKLVDGTILNDLQKEFDIAIPYRALQLGKFLSLDKGVHRRIEKKHQIITDLSSVNFQDVQSQETAIRHEVVEKLLKRTLKKSEAERPSFSRAIDAIVLHPLWGMLIFLSIMFVMFQAIFSWAEWPMDQIDQAFASLSALVQNTLPQGMLTDLLSEGIITGLGGIVIFVPQIALLFAFLALLEGSGYMARAVFITDRVMRPFGLNGRSVVPLISGFACAIPAIMSARTISNKKDKLITIFVTPFMSCSARLPVYIILVGLLFPESSTSFFNPKGMALFFLYFLGILAALISAVAMKFIMKRQKEGRLMLELPRYKYPNLKTVAFTVYEKSKTFVVEAGKIILMISVVLWVLASYGPGNSMETAAESVPVPTNPTEVEMQNYKTSIASKKLRASYAGRLGRLIEPVIEPLGYDWKIGIALICSFAAREVFVSTIATLYAIGDDDIKTLQELLSEETDDRGAPVFTPAVLWSLLIFYAFAMQCMSTVAVVYRETKSWKIPILQTAYMTIFAYISSLLVYQLLS